MFPPTMPIGEAREKLREIISERGESHDCPVCRRHTQIYWHPINANMARGVIALYIDHGLHWGDINLVRIRHNLHRSKQETTAARWGLIEEETEIRRDDGGRAGFWRVTPFGEAWIHERTTIQKYAKLYDSRCLGYDGPPVTIREALGMKFNYDDLMRGNDA